MSQNLSISSRFSTYLLEVFIVFSDGSLYFCGISGIFLWDQVDCNTWLFFFFAFHLLGKYFSIPLF